MFQHNGGITTNIVVSVSEIYPGMVTFQKVIEVQNRGEVTANLSYEVQSLRVLNNTYEVGVNGETSSSIESRMTNDYPFTITITKDQSQLNAVNGVGHYTIEVSWPYESGDDVEDTYWGEQSYAYHQNNPSDECIELNVMLIATQPPAGS